MTFLRLAVVGDPIGHSASPRLHRGFLAAAGRDGTYEAIRVAAGDGALAFATLRGRGYRGLNVTTPLKEEAYAFSDELDPVARASGAVNTLVFGRTTTLGANTDGAGAVGALRAAGLPALEGRTVGILGTGPTARAAAIALATAGVAVRIAGRDVARARATAALLAAADRDRDVRTWAGDRVDAVFATLPPHADVPGGVVDAVRRADVVVDANYAARATLARRLGRDDVADGSAMLEASAAASFALFAGIGATSSTTLEGTAPRRGGDSNSRDR